MCGRECLRNPEAQGVQERSQRIYFLVTDSDSADGFGFRVTMMLAHLASLLLLLAGGDAKCAYTVQELRTRRPSRRPRRCAPSVTRFRRARCPSPASARSRTRRARTACCASTTPPRSPATTARPSAAASPTATRRSRACAGSCRRRTSRAVRANNPEIDLRRRVRARASRDAVVTLMCMPPPGDVRFGVQTNVQARWRAAPATTAAAAAAAAAARRAPTAAAAGDGVIGLTYPEIGWGDALNQHTLRVRDNPAPNATWDGLVAIVTTARRRARRLSAARGPALGRAAGGRLPRGLPLNVEVVDATLARLATPGADWRRDRRARASRRSCGTACRSSTAAVASAWLNASWPSLLVRAAPPARAPPPPPRASAAARARRARLDPRWAARTRRPPSARSSRRCARA